MIIKVKKGWKVKSHTSGRSFGTYPRKKKAIIRLRQVKFFGAKE